MRDFAAVTIEVNNFLGHDSLRAAAFVLHNAAIHEAFFDRHFREISGEFVILVLRPPFEWVVVAFIAIETHAEEGLANVFSNFAGLAQNAVVIDRRIFVGVAFGEQDFADEFVVGLVFADRLADPIFILPDRFLAERFAAALQEVGPFVGPIFGVVV